MDSRLTLKASFPSITDSDSVFEKNLTLLKDFFGEHYFFISAIAVFILSVWLTAWYYGVVDRISAGIYSKQFILLLLLYILVFLMGHAAYVMAFIRPHYLVQYILNDLKNKYITPKRWLNALPAIILFQFFFCSFTSLKSMIPAINPYSWDSFLIQLDKTIHFGHQPWQILDPLLGKPIITYAINYMYNIWIIVIISVLFHQIFSLEDRKLRMQFLLATVGVWSIIGGLFATCFSSAGPCFYGDLTGNHQIYGPLMNYLSVAAEKYNIFALQTQEYLWDNFINNKMAIGSGISAMPSMHVSTTFLSALMTWKKNVFLGSILFIYTFFIMIGSVHLAWHYAVDGYLSIFLTFIVWHVAGRIARRIPLYEKPKISSIANVDLKQ